MHYFWCVIYFLALLLHLTYGIWLALLVYKYIRVKKDFAKVYLLVFLCIILIDITFSGCPLTYLEETIKVKAGWIDHVGYNFYDSLVYRFIVKPFTGDIAPKKPVKQSLKPPPRTRWLLIYKRALIR